jgi:hypothetical protein
MSPKAEFDWQILMEATIVPPAERFPWNESRRTESVPPPAQSSRARSDSSHESHLDGGVPLTSR